MDIKDIKSEKSKLDEQIANMLRTFESKTGVHVESIDIERLPMYTGMMNEGGLLVYTKVRI